MADFFELPIDERCEALAVAAAASGRPVHLLEKDIWVVWALAHLFGLPFAEHLVFKGGKIPFEGVQRDTQVPGSGGCHLRHSCHRET